ncbi:hypothetical protein LPJ78_002933 [Coemansia sp. RSA 989]|nr:hypothetical protein BX667DRAFT_505403 [Coemansia mojavensis]KAJ1741898.1 hypothetical protein LPJ68_002449 [Coemansia sp. RSA 1086]KAJ1750439.1 hypothetical protein LPJ79_002865 [Coemansia sp. RSA 1821]KAJ1865042.1 hypothetical protein LPJ78_002933 [Coemansia sp. RSA 989]KAJ1872399.1 hypothetical protein LPJ55_003093 [Coemansia sp. RSA 990]KAJ2631648.1 hypothetical protein H4R22_001823 [Coemansia sp. RSA 1290]KAJ2652704.1 hypothetical protein IWW40_000815 [Coemansia sp. RSA 1250]KAJ26753
MGLAYAGTSIFRTAALAFAWPLSIIALILSCLVAANGHWKPRAASIWTAIVSCLTILTIPLLLLGKTLRLTRLGGARCTRMWELILTGMWLASWVWIATQLNKFHCTNPTYNSVTSSSISTPVVPNAGSVIPVVNSPVGFSLYGHALTPQGAPRDALDTMHHGAKALLHNSKERALGYNGRRRYARRCRCFKALLGFAIPIFAILALDVLAHMWRSGERDLSRSPSVTSSVSSVEAPAAVGAVGPERAPAAGVPAAETKV